MARKSARISARISGHGAADSDPRISALSRDLDQQRLIGAGLLAATIADRLGPDRVDDIRAALWVLMSPLQFGLIVRDRGRLLAYYQTWTAHALRALLPPLE